MTHKRSGSAVLRRSFLGAAAAGLALGRNGTAAAADQQKRPPKRQTVRDKFWIFTCPSGTDDRSLPRSSRMTPAEGAFYLGVPNLLMIRCDGRPAMPSDQYAVPFRPLKRVVWSLTGSGGVTSEEERKDAFRIARRFPNVTGFIMDDFFNRDGTGKLAPEQLQDLRKRLTVDGRKLDLYVVLYTHQLELPVAEHLKFCDKITFWTWHAKELVNLEKNFQRLEKLAPDHGKLLGLYIWDYPTKTAVPVELMKKQCQLGLKWLRQGRLEGMIFLANTVLDVGAESGLWAREWIAKVGDQPL